MSAEFIEKMLAFRKKWIAKYGGEVFLGIPDVWFEPKTHYRCANNHVSTAILSSEAKGDLCLECQATVMITFPGDVDGPFPEEPL